MSGITIELAKEMLDLWIEAERKVTTGQSYKIGSRTLTRANVSDIRNSINYWRNEVDRLENGGGRGAKVLRGLPLDL